jgi:hypothetical protein
MADLEDVRRTTSSPPGDGCAPVRALVDDLDTVVAAAVAALRTVADRDWHVPARGLEWDCWETVEHVADDLFAYAGQVAVRTPETSSYVPFAFTADRPGAPNLSVRARVDRGNVGLVQVLDACGGFLSAVARDADAGRRGWHPWGVSDPGGFAAMGTVEVLLHLYDTARPLGLGWDPDPDVVRRVLDRLFPDAPAHGDPWLTLLRATGRDPEVRVPEWRWDASVRQ